MGSGLMLGKHGQSHSQTSEALGEYEPLPTHAKFEKKIKEQTVYPYVLYFVQ